MNEPLDLVVARRSVVRAAAHFESRHPTWLVSHPLAAGWVWAAIWVPVLLAADHFDWHAAIWVLVVVLMVAPTFTATVVVLSHTPHSSLRREESVLGHFFNRFAGYAFAFVVWTASVVLSAAIATDLQSAGHGNEQDTIGAGISLLVAAVPVVVSFLWLLLILRYVWFLTRLRGWRARPAMTRLPSRFLEDAPRTRAIILGLAHPGLLLATGTLSVLIAGLLYIDDVTINLI
ncbi:hypothetical protein WDJ51_12175 [Rathayibacter sp. YIM 133350]|uniref:hypothetical protein n=1 Tax=Rathayibacter sp. YIM 133350 TaxID=3131992 RepID=UPI00307CF409